jgi:hypothetical protein
MRERYARCLGARNTHKEECQRGAITWPEPSPDCCPRNAHADATAGLSPRRHRDTVRVQDHPNARCRSHAGVSSGRSLPMAEGPA